jgi:Icc-related predicted phosphoesterase
MGNDDPRFEEAAVWEAATQDVWEYIHNRKVRFKDFDVYGYGYVPPTPFRLKDWERYDVSRYVDPGSISPEEGVRSFPVSDQEKRYATIQEDLARLAGNKNLDRAIFLFHSPPYETNLDLAALGGKMIDHVPLDQHLGSIAIRRFIEARQPLLSLHGHIHESVRLSLSWRDLIGRTHCFSAAHDGPELALIRFDPDRLEAATRELV